MAGWRLRAVSVVLIAILGSVAAADAICGIWCDAASLPFTSTEDTAKVAHGHHGEPNPDAAGISGEHAHHAPAVTPASSTTTDTDHSMAVAADSCRTIAASSLQAIVHGRSDDVVNLDRSSPVPVATSDGPQAHALMAARARDTFPPGCLAPGQLPTVLRI